MIVDPSQPIGFNPNDIPDNADMEVLGGEELKKALKKMDKEMKKKFPDMTPEAAALLPSRVVGDGTGKVKLARNKKTGLLVFKMKKQDVFG